MGLSGQCRVRPVHVAGLIKRYRQLLGEHRYVVVHPPLNTARREILSTTILAIAEAIRIQDSAISLGELRPISYRPAQPLPGMALTRALLSTLRGAAGQLDVDTLVATLLKRHGVTLDAEADVQRFFRRVKHVLLSLEKRKIVKHQAGRWQI